MQTGESELGDGKSRGYAKVDNALLAVRHSPPPYLISRTDKP